METTFGAGSFVGSPLRRVEDADLLQGRGTYIDNLALDGVLHVSFVRSPFAHAMIRGIDLARARSAPGVVGAYRAADLELPLFGGIVQLHPDVSRPPLASDRVRFVGDPVVVVAAGTKTQAVDAGELVEVEYDPIPAVIDMEAALLAEAPQQFEGLGSNVVMTTSGAPVGDDVLADAEIVVRGRFENQRLAVVPMEASAIAVVPGDDHHGHDLTVHLACQMPHHMQGMISTLFALPRERVRVITPDVGGSFGAKHLSVEGVVAIRLALELGRPVKWIETRSESMVALPHGRGQVQYVEMGFLRDGSITGLRCRFVGDAGAYAGLGGMLVHGSTRKMAQGVYDIPKISFEAATVMTNTTPMGAYRGAGRPEAAAFLERILDIAAGELGIDPVVLRRKNLLRADEFPYATRTGVSYDSGDYEAALDEALRLADYESLRAEQRARRERGDLRQLGIGVSLYVEITAGTAGSEYAQVEVHDDGTVMVKAGTSAHGQGHATVYTAIVADQLGVPLERIRVVQSDTASVARGGGTGGSWSMQLGGTAVLEAAELIAQRAKAIVADLFEASPEDVVVVPGAGLGVIGVPSRALSWSDVAQAATERGEPLVVDHDFRPTGPTFPFGAHVAVVEVDMETGRVEPVRHIAVDDCGRILNPLLVDGQVHGGLASGIAQALWERFVYDEAGNPLTTTLAEYAMPSAAELCSYEVGHTETPSPYNALGAKGIGESATVGSTPAVQNAVVDALSHLGVRHIDLPCTPERVWRAIHDARSGRFAPLWRDPPVDLLTHSTAESSSVEDVNL